jgi:predicted transcriptional regulator
MPKEKLVISSKKYRGDTSVVSIRLPDELVKTIDGVAEETGRTRNEIIQKSLAFALDNLEIKEY